MTAPECVSGEEKAGAQLLADPVVRRAAIAIASSGGLLVGDIPKQLPEEERHRATDVVQVLEATGLVAVELLVICSRTSAQVARVPNSEAIGKMSDAGVKCACRREISSERIEQPLTISDLGRKL